MNAENFFKNHSLEEISKKTKISPISLRFIRNKEFDKIPKVKFMGFIKIIQNSYNIDLSDLIEEYNNTKHPKKEEPIHKKTKNKNSTFFITIFSFILIILGGFLLFKNLNSSKQALPNIIEKNITQTNTVIANNSISTSKNSLNISNQLETNPKPITIKDQNTSIKYKIIIKPNKLLWFKATNIDTNKSIQFLTSHKKILPKGNYYIKFGHGEFNLTYNKQTITPNTQKVIRILFKNGKYKFMKKPNRYEK